MFTRMYSTNVTSVIKSLHFEGHSEYIGEHTEDLGYISVLQGPVAENINGHRTCIDISRSTLNVCMGAVCAITQPPKIFAEEAFKEA